MKLSSPRIRNKNYSARRERFPLFLSCTILLLCLQRPYHHCHAQANDENLVFRADCRLRSEEFFASDKSMLREFLLLTETRNLLLSAGGQRHCQQVPLSTPTKHLWKQICNDRDDSSAMTEDSNKVTMMATETKVKFPGFLLRNTVLNACRLIKHDTESGLPALDFCLIGDKKHVEGNAPVVWLVQKLTGISEYDPEQFFEQSETSAMTHVHVVPSSQGKTEQLQLEMKIDFKTTVAFPKRMLKVLPASKDKVEKRGSDSISKVIRKDGRDALQAVRQAWLEFEQKQQRETAATFRDRIKRPSVFSRVNIRSQSPFKIN